MSQRLDYTNVLLYGLRKCVIYNLQKVHNSAAPKLTGVFHRKHISPVRQDLHCLPVRCRSSSHWCIKSKVVFLQPIYLSLLNPIDQPGYYTLDLWIIIRLWSYQHILSLEETAFSKAGPLLWNNPPLHIRRTESLYYFKCLLKTHLFHI